MVFEQLYSPSWIREKPFFAFIMGVCYTSVSVGISLLLFPEDPSMAAVFLTTIVLIPTLNKLLSKEEKDVAKHEYKEFKIKNFYEEHKEIILIYFFLFLGVLLIFGLFNVLMPTAAREYIFNKQLFAYEFEMTTGSAVNVDYARFLLSRNIVVLFVCFIFSLVYGSGAILLIAWNAAAWGSIFGDMAQRVAQTQGINPILSFIRFMIPVLPHTIFEGGGYLLAAIAGGIISKAVIKEEWGSPRFQRVTQDSLMILTLGVILIILGAIIESGVGL